jgi:hypothetical protein
MLDRASKVALGGLLHLADNESSDLGWRVLLAAGLEPGVTVRVLDNLEGNVVEILLHLSVGEFASDQTLGGEESVLKKKANVSTCYLHSYEERRGRGD